jgi:diguanylate cyclase (GGDEF)-like protein
VIPTVSDGTFAHQLSKAFLLFGAIVASAFIVTTVSFVVCWGWLTPDFERSQAAVRAESLAHTALLAEENGLRGFLLTKDPRFKTPPEAGELLLVRANDVLTELIGAVPELSALMFRTRLAEETWRERWAKVMGATSGSANSGTGALPSMAEGRVLFEAYRKEQTVFAQALDRHSAALLRREHLIVTSRVSLQSGIFLLVLFLAVRQHRAITDAVLAPLAALLAHVRRIRDGQLATGEAAGPRELAELAEGLNEMVGALAAARASAESSDETVRHHATQLRLILDASREFSESLNLAYVVGAVRESTAAVGGYDRVIVWIMDDEQKFLVNADKSALPLEPHGPSDGLASRAAKAGRITFEGPTSQVRFGDSNTGSVRAIAIPLIVGARVVGALEARHAEPKVASTQAVELLETLATHAATAIESARLHAVIEERSQMDALTRLFNRRRLEEDLDAECKRCLRYGRPLAFVMVDVDDFKLFNDTNGHPQGDTALQQVAEVIAGCVRVTDSAYRYGGEEFCVMLRETRAEDGVLFAERLRRRVEKRFGSRGSSNITVSVGVAGFSTEMPTPRAMVEAADAAMYESKHAGKNRVTLSPPTAFMAEPPVGKILPVHS